MALVWRVMENRAVFRNTPAIRLTFNVSFPGLEVPGEHFQGTGNGRSPDATDGTAGGVPGWPRVEMPV